MEKIKTSVTLLALVCGSTNAALIYDKDGSKIDLNGRVKAEYYFSNDNSKNGDQTNSRLGFKVDSQIDENLAGFAVWQYQFGANRIETDSSGNRNRLSYAGLRDNRFGSFSYGRSYGIMYNVSSFTDRLPELGCETLKYTDVYMTGRSTGQAIWSTTDFFGLVDGFNLAVEYQGKNETSRGVNKQNGDGFGFSALYSVDNFTFGTAYSNSDRTEEQLSKAKTEPNVFANGNKAEMWSAGVKYAADRIYIATIYGESHNMTPFGSGYIADKTKNFEAVVQYTFNNGLKPSLAYLQSTAVSQNAGSNVDIVKYLDVGATWDLSKNIAVLVEYKINLINSSDYTKSVKISSDDIIVTGINYTF
ncbi:TPA: porin [Klebsiella variicola]|nr:porin [Klebsiella variicola]